MFYNCGKQPILMHIYCNMINLYSQLNVILRGLIVVMITHLIFIITIVVKDLAFYTSFCGQITNSCGQKKEPNPNQE